MIGFSSVARARWANAGRITACTLGAYGLTALVIAALSRLLVRLGTDAVEAVTGVTLASFALFAVIAMSAFHARNPARAWSVMILLALPPAMLLLMLSE
ncbi:hypothetical protein [Sphingobium yanoikuyae]|uniref:hypothetical protein n=1 Tax=Sphingobium yanoikuyae TaxID=13690 RepID=UPI0028AF1C6B|nr:hypothetical protein [Sphingobium yanoikuyae]